MSLAKLEYDESLHPRDERGKFVETGGTKPLSVDEVEVRGPGGDPLPVFDKDGIFNEALAHPSGPIGISEISENFKVSDSAYGPYSGDVGVTGAEQVEGSEGSYEMNAYLRGDLDPSETSQEALDAIDELDKAFDDPQYVLKEDVTVFRGATDLDLKQGDVYQEKGFLSTTADPGVATDYVDPNAEGVYVMAIQVPAGTPAMYLPDLLDQPPGGFPNQKEILLDRDTKIVIDEVSERGVTARVVTN